jgi:peptidoglycan/LPS O-acetylase OafA/YrhL
MNTYAGIFFAQLSVDPPSIFHNQSQRILRKTIASFCIFTGLLLCSFPESNPQWGSWSPILFTVGNKLFPQGTSVSHYWDSVGAAMFFYGAMLSGTTRRILAHPMFCWLGKISLPLYLIHAMTLRSVLVWVLFGLTPQTLDFNKTESQSPPKLQNPSGYLCLAVIPFYIALVLYLSHLWNIHIEPWCFWLTKRLEELLSTEKST